MPAARKERLNAAEFGNEERIRNPQRAGEFDRGSQRRGVVGRQWGAFVYSCRRMLKMVVSFVHAAIREDWSAAPIALVASFVGTFLTAVLVTLMAPIAEGAFGSTKAAGYIIATSSVAIILGYSLYCIFYWGGMLLKERKHLVGADGKFSRLKLSEKLQVFKADFLLHLPSDGYWIFGMLGTQGGLYASGATDLFWSIFLSQSISDVYYSLREPFYWRGAKNITAWRASRSSEKIQAANSDVAAVSEERVAGNF
jgi:hypothetical protein